MWLVVRILERILSAARFAFEEIRFNML